VVEHEGEEVLRIAGPVSELLSGSTLEVVLQESEDGSDGPSIALQRLTKPGGGYAEGMAKKLVTDELWEVIEPLLPREPPKPKGGRPRIDDRAALTGILFVLKSGIPWEMLPQEMGCGSGMTCWRRLKEWHEAGVWQELHRMLLDRLGKADEIDWERASLDSASVPAPGGAKRPARIRQIRANRARSATLWSTEKAFPSR
jgi:transposase